MYNLLIVYIVQSQSHSSSHPCAFSPWYPYICSLHLCLYFSFANKIIYTIFQRRKWQPTPVFLPRESWWAPVHGIAQSWTQLKCLSMHVCVGEGPGNSLQYSCLENPMDGGAWKAAVHGGRWGSDTTERLHFHFSLSCTGEGNGNPLQCSCLENPRDGGAWWAAVYGVAQSWTRLKWLSSSSSIPFF